MSETRDRSSSRDRGRGSAGRDTNSNDSHALRCRVFIGNLATDKTNKAEVEEIFEKFGGVASCSLHNNFGFIQYHEDKDADRAVEEMHGKTLFGKRIDVNLAGLRRKPQSKDQYEGAPPKEAVVPPDMLKNSGRPPRPRDRSPLRGDREVPYGRPGNYDNASYDAYNRPHGNRPLEYPGSRRMDPYGVYDNRDNSSPYMNDYRDAPYRRPMDDPRPPIQRLRPAIDCEIVSLSKEETRYAEEVESRIRSIGLVCNIGFPPSDLPILELMDRIARTGTLYAVVVTSQNAQHRSCTLYKLHGPTREEHRNMPLDDALSFVARNFDSYLRSLRDPRSAPVATSYVPQRDSIPRVPPAPAQVPTPQNPVTSYPSEKQMSTEQIEAMIEKLRREKEEREAAAKPPQSEQSPAVDKDRQQEVSGQVQSEPAPAVSSNYSSYSNFLPPQVQNNGAPTGAPSEGYYQQPQQYEQQPLYR